VDERTEPEGRRDDLTQAETRALIARLFTLFGGAHGDEDTSPTLCERVRGRKRPRDGATVAR
jgi:hypothetical protein